MIVLLSVFKVLVPMAYLVVWGLYLWLFTTDHPTARRFCTRFGFAAAALHLVALTVRGFALGRLPMGGPLEFSSALGVAMLLTYLAIETRLKAKNTGFLITGMAFILVFVGNALSTTAPEASAYLQDPGYAGHAVLVLFAYTALSLSFLFAVLYLILNRQLMRHQFGLLFQRLPSLDTLERMSVGAVELGVPLLFLSLCLGHLWMYDLADRVDPEMAAMLSPYDPKIMISWGILLAYTVGLIGYRFLGWRGRRMNIMAVVAYVVVVATMGMVQHFFPSFHKFKSTQSVTSLSQEIPGVQKVPLLVASHEEDAR
jgi:HemX protein